MTAIRSLADELREKMRQQTEPENAEPEKQIQEAAASLNKSSKKKTDKLPPTNPSTDLEALFAQLSAYELNGNEKLLIRLESKTVFMLKQLKVTKSIDMNKLIAYSLDAFFKERPDLIKYIKSSLQTIEL